MVGDFLPCTEKRRDLPVIEQSFDVPRRVSRVSGISEAIPDISDYIATEGCLPTEEISVKDQMISKHAAEYFLTRT